jgi:predicted negative regulator of RcsB-dependent stress response
MATKKQQTTNYKQLFFGVLIIFLGLLGRRIYLKVSDVILEKSIVSIQNKIQKEQAHLDSFSDKP